MEKLIEQLKNSFIAISCATQLEATQLMEQCVKYGVKWRNGSLVNIRESHFSQARTKPGDEVVYTCINRRNAMGVSDRGFHEAHFPEIKIVRFADALHDDIY